MAAKQKGCVVRVLRRRLRRLTLLLALSAVPLFDHSAAPAMARREQLPNLVALAPYDLKIAEADSPGPGHPIPRAIRFATGAANRGDHALELLGRPSTLDSAVAQQCVSWSAPRVCAARQDVGDFEWHAAHGHYHFQEFALYELRRIRRGGKVDQTSGGLVATSGKVSYCIIDYEEDDPNRGLLYTAPYPLYYSCLAGLSMQGISPGWRDVYGSRTIGQQIPLDGIADGTYALVVEIDPSGRLLETDETDNRALVHLRLSRGGKKVEVLCEQEPGDETCAPVEPSQ